MVEDRTHAPDVVEQGRVPGAGLVGEDPELRTGHVLGRVVEPPQGVQDLLPGDHLQGDPPREPLHLLSKRRVGLGSVVRGGPPASEEADERTEEGHPPDEQNAEAEVEIAKAAWLEAAREAGKPIPPPKYRPVIYQLS